MSSPSPQESRQAYVLYLCLRLHRSYSVTKLLAADGLFVYIYIYICIYIFGLIFIHILLHFRKCSVKSNKLPQNYELFINSGMILLLHNYFQKSERDTVSICSLLFLLFLFLCTEWQVHVPPVWTHHKSVLFTNHQHHTKNNKICHCSTILVSCLRNDITDHWLINYSNGPFLGKRAL